MNSKNMPEWLKPVATLVVVLTAGILIAGILSVPWRASRPLEGADQPRVHFNTKNSTRFAGNNVTETAALVGQAVYPATDNPSRPNVVLLYDPENWQAGLLAASLLRPLNGVLLPAAEGIEAEIGRLGPMGSQAANGASVLLLDGASAPQGAAGEALALADILALRLSLDPAPQHAILINPSDPQTALLAAPWAAYSGDLVVFEASQLPSGLPAYSLGTLEAEGTRHIGGNNPAQVAVNFAQYEDEENPLFGWGFNANSLTGYRAFTLARADDPATALVGGRKAPAAGGR